MSTAEEKKLLAAIDEDVSALEGADPSLKKNKKFILAAVQVNGYALEYADQSLKKDKEVVLAAGQEDGGDALEYADKSLHMIKINIKGQGGEFTLGGVNEKQINFIYDKLQNADDNHGRKHLDDVFETDELSKPWNEIDQITHMFGVNPDNFFLDSDDKNFVNIDIKTKGLGAFEIDYENDDRLEFVDDNKKVILGWNNLNSNFDKGFHTFKMKDFSKKTLEILKEGGLLGTDSIENGYFGEFSLPGDFDKSKLILVWSKFKFEEYEVNQSNTILSKIFYDGEEVEMVMTGDTITKDKYHFIVESNVNKDEVSLDYTGDEFTSS